MDKVLKSIPMDWIIFFHVLGDLKNEKRQHVPLTLQTTDDPNFKLLTLNPISSALNGPNGIISVPIR